MFSFPTTQELWSELSAGTPEGSAIRAYFASRIRNRLFDYVLKKFEEAEGDGLTKAELARRMGTRPEVVNRYLASPGNWELSTLSALLLGIAGEELAPASAPVVGLPSRNRRASDLLAEQKRKEPSISGETIQGQLDKKNSQYRFNALDEASAL